jgi:hypothetical protein
MPFSVPILEFRLFRLSIADGECNGCAIPVLCDFAGTFTPPVEIGHKCAQLYLRSLHCFRPMSEIEMDGTQWPRFSNPPSLDKRFIIIMGTTTKAALAATVATAVLSLTTMAPAAAKTGDTPSYTVASEDHIQGRIAKITGKYSIEVRVKGYIDSVSLHNGTIINPIGLTLEPGFRVTIYGQPAGSTFVANEIDTPYKYAQVAYYPYPDYGFYPYYDRFFGFGYPFGV